MKRESCVALQYIILHVLFVIELRQSSAVGGPHGREKLKLEQATARVCESKAHQRTLRWENTHTDLNGNTYPLPHYINSRPCDALLLTFFHTMLTLNSFLV
jgi:hypothetical protein